MTGTVRLEVDGPIAVIVNDNPGKHNAFTDDMDVQLFELLADAEGAGRTSAPSCGVARGRLGPRAATLPPLAPTSTISPTTS